jgi:Calx-beta domain/von Willebrand factor type A domain
MASVKRRAALLTVVAVAIATVSVTAPAPQAAAAVAGVDPARAELTLAPGATGSVAANVTTPAVAPNPDIVFLADTTGSMDPALANVRNRLPSIIDEVRAAQPTARFGAAEYKERADGNRVFRVDAGLTEDKNTAVNGAQQWLYNVGGGGQPQSDFLNAHYQLATGAMSFREQGTRVVVWFGDARSNDPSLGHTLADTVNALKAKGIRVIAVPVTGTSAPGLNETGQATTLTNRTFGVLMPNQSASGVGTAILNAIKTLNVPVTAAPTCDQQLTLTPDRPTRMIPSGGTASFTSKVTVAPNTTAGTYECTVDFRASGVSMGFTQTVTVHVPGTLPSLRISDVTVDEGNYYTPATLTVTMDRPSTGRVTVGWSTVAGTADAEDFAAGSGTLTFAPGETSKQVTVNVLGDDYDEPDETFTVRLAGPTGATLADPDGVVTIRDDDAPPVLRISDTSQAEDDEDTTATLTVTLDRPADEPVTVRWQTIAGTADTYDFQSGEGQLTFEPGETSKQVNVTVHGDEAEEPDETFTVRLSEPTGATIEDADGVVTLLNDDSDSPPTDTAVRIGDAVVPEGNVGTTPVTLTVTIDEPSTTPVSVYWSTVANTANAADFVDQGNDLIFAPGETSKQITVAVVGDQLQEGDETFGVQLTAPASIDDTALITITEDDMDTGPHPSPPPPALRVGDVSVPEGDDGNTPATVTVVLDKVLDVPVSVYWATANGTATAPGDYTAASGTVTFTPGETARQITVPITGDPSEESTETFAIQLSGPVNAEVVDGTAVVTITNDDEYGGTSVLSIDDTTVSENIGCAMLTVRLSAARDEAVTVHVTTTPGSADEGYDFTGVDTTVTFPPGETLVQVPVEIIDNNEAEPVETFSASLSDASGGVPIAISTAVVTIEDDDGSSDLPVVSVDDAFTPENAGPARFVVHLTKPATGEVTVHWATEDGTATSYDYASSQGDVTFAPGQTETTVEVALYDDDSYEHEESFILRLSSPSGAVLGDAEATGVIVDDDDYVNTPIVSVSDAAALEANGQLGFEIQLSEAVSSSAFEVTVDWATSDGSATAPGDYAASSGTVVFAEGQSTATVWVPVANETLVEPDETFTVTLTGTQNATIGDGTAVGTIVNDDSGGVVTFTCTSTAADLLGSHPAVANKGSAQCADDTRTKGRATLGAGLLKIRVDGLTANTDAAPGGMSATSTLRTTRITGIGLVIEIGTMTSTATVTCVAGPTGLTPTFTGSSAIASLKVNGVRMKIGTGPTKIRLPVGSLSLNSTTSGPAGLTQRAFDLRTPLGHVVIGASTVGAAGNPCH